MDTVGIPMNEGFGGAGLGAAAVGFILGGMMNGGWGNGWGGGGRAMQAGADVALANQMEHVSDQVQQATISNLQSANGTQMQIAGAAANVTQGINANTVAGMQGDAAIQQQICCAAGRISQEIDNTGDQAVNAINQANIQSMQNTQAVMAGLANIGQAVTNQGYQAQLTAKDETLLLTQQHSQIMAAIADSNARNEQQHCQDRELIREMATQNRRDKNAELAAAVAAKDAQINLYTQLGSTAQYIINNVKTPTTAAAGA